jgi:hypothetical protein
MTKEQLNQAQEITNKIISAQHAYSIIVELLPSESKYFSEEVAAFRKVMDDKLKTIIEDYELKLAQV